MNELESENNIDHFLVSCASFYSQRTQLLLYTIPTVMITSESYLVPLCYIPCVKEAGGSHKADRAGCSKYSAISRLFKVQEKERGFLLVMGL